MSRKRMQGMAAVRNTMVAVLAVSLSMAEGRAESQQQTGVGLGAEVSVSHHNNPFYRESSKAKDGVVFDAVPQLQIGLNPSEFLHFGIAARAKYTHVSVSDADDGGDGDKDVLHPFVVGRVRYNPSPYTSLFVRDEYQQANVGDRIGGDKYSLNQATVGGVQEVGSRSKAGVWYRNSVLSEDSASLLFDYVENAVGVDLGYVLTRTGAGRDVTLALNTAAGSKEFDRGAFLGQTTTENPKTHTFYDVGTSLTLPLSSAVTANLNMGVKRREYDVVSAGSGAKSETDALSAGASVTMIPGGLVSYTLSASRSVEDTLVQGSADDEVSPVFDALDPLLSNLDTSYREVDVTRIGCRMDYPMSDRTRLGLGVGYQRSEADKDEDLTRISGQSGVPAADLRENRYSAGVSLHVRLSERLSAAASYRYGLSEERGSDLYQYDAVAAILRLQI